MPDANKIDEKTYRQLLDQSYARIDAAFVPGTVVGVTTPLASGTVLTCSKLPVLNSLCAKARAFLR